MADYKLTDSDAVIRIAGNLYIPNDPNNRDRKDYNTWLAEGNTPDPHVPPVAAAPASVSTLGFKMALEEVGQWQAAKTKINQLGAADDFLLATVITRKDIEMLGTLATAQEITAIMTRGNQIASMPHATPPPNAVSIFRSRP